MADFYLVGKGASTTNTVSSSAGVVPHGHTLDVTINYDNSASVSSVSDNAGNTYTLTDLARPGFGVTAKYRCVNCIGHSALVVTVNFSATAFPTIEVVAVTAATDTSFDTATGVTDTTVPTSLAIGPMAQADHVIVSSAGINDGPSNTSYTADNSMTTVGEETNTTIYWTSAAGALRRFVTSAITIIWNRVGAGATRGNAIHAAYKVYDLGFDLAYEFLGASGVDITTGPFDSDASGSVILVLTAFGDLTTAGSQTISDNKGNSYSAVGVAHAYTDWPTSGTQLKAKENAAGGAGHTVTASIPTTNDEMTLAVVEVRDVAAVNSHTWTQNSTSGSATTTTGSITLGAGTFRLVSFWSGDNVNGELLPNVSSPWKILKHTSNFASNHVQVAMAYREVTGPGTFTAVWTPSQPQGAQVWMVALGAPAVVAGPVVTPDMSRFPKPPLSRYRTIQ